MEPKTMPADGSRTTARGPGALRRRDLVDDMRMGLEGVFGGRHLLHKDGNHQLYTCTYGMKRGKAEAGDGIRHGR